ncbi:hypothetical protein EZV62_006553 [Acer yangbiense]|uniref:Leucine-rich repeat-containing N-terminal plant-type domain-containing protein n=1 Tax=Acer yangbiense TaxID=1000413 RepID=A0A5C7I886_9ROSI|nr:hypothetical protein EZV62_006553 [Acer yangbiense]
MNNVDLYLVGSDWIGVLNMNLTELHLSSCLLTVSIPSTEPINSTSFTVLDLSSNPLNSELPDWLVIVSTLVHVDLSYCNLYGRIPLGFSELPNLQYFNLAGNNNLSVSCSQLFRGSWKMILYINLASNKLHGKLHSSIGNVTFRTNFDLSLNNVGGGIPSSIGPIPASLGNLQNLTKLSLEGNELNGALLESFGNLSELSTLDVSVNYLIDVDLSSNLLEGLIPLPNVEIELLDLSNNRFSGSIPQNICESMPNLIFLSLSGNQLTGEIPASIGEMMLLLQVIDLSRNNISGTIPSSIGNCSLLKVLDLAYNNLSGEIPATLVSLVTSLDLSGSNLSGDFPEELTKLSGLVVLNLSRNHISAKIPENISSLHQLSSLDLSSNNLSGSIPPTLSSLSFIGYLNLSNNDFSGTIPYAEHLTTYNASSFSGNPALCEPPLNVKCQDEDSDSQMEEEVSIKITIMEMNKK